MTILAFFAFYSWLIKTGIEIQCNARPNWHWAYIPTKSEEMISNSPNSRLVNSDRMPLAARIDSAQKANIISTWSHRVQKCEILWVQRSWTQIFREIFEDPVGISGPIANSGWLTSPCKISQCAYCSAKRGRGKKLLCNAGEVIGDTPIGLHFLRGVLIECLHGKLLTSGKSAWKWFLCGITRWGSHWLQCSVAISYSADRPLPLRNGHVWQIEKLTLNFCHFDWYCVSLLFYGFRFDLLQGPIPYLVSIIYLILSFCRAI